MASNLPALKKYLAAPETEQRIAALMDDSSVFNASLVNLVADDKMLINCKPETIMAAALKSAALKLPIDKQLGFAYIVAYKDEAQFQLGYKGYVQLAIRSGEYKTIHATEVYKDEFKHYNPLTGDVGINMAKLEGERYKEESEPIGYYAYFELKNGFTKSLFMTKKEMFEYAKKYSQAFKNDLKKGWKSSPWSKEFDSMSKGKMLKIMLRTYGILSIDMVKAFEQDDAADKVTDAETGQKIEAPAKAQEVKPEVVSAPVQQTPIPVQSEDEKKIEALKAQAKDLGITMRVNATDTPEMVEKRLKAKVDEMAQAQTEEAPVVVPQQVSAPVVATVVVEQTPPANDAPPLTDQDAAVMDMFN